VYECVMCIYVYIYINELIEAPSNRNETTTNIHEYINSTPESYCPKETSSAQRPSTREYGVKDLPYHKVETKQNVDVSHRPDERQNVCVEATCLVSESDQNRISHSKSESDEIVSRPASWSMAEVGMYSNSTQTYGKHSGRQADRQVDDRWEKSADFGFIGRMLTQDDILFREYAALQFSNEGKDADFMPTGEDKDGFRCNKNKNNRRTDATDTSAGGVKEPLMEIRALILMLRHCKIMPRWLSGGAWCVCVCVCVCVCGVTGSNRCLLVDARTLQSPQATSMWAFVCMHAGIVNIHTYTHIRTRRRSQECVAHHRPN
jgi:hypothetical protein